MCQREVGWLVGHCGPNLLVASAYFPLIASFLFADECWNVLWLPASSNASHQHDHVDQLIDSIEGYKETVFF